MNPRGNALDVVLLASLAACGTPHRAPDGGADVATRADAVADDAARASDAPTGPGGDAAGGDGAPPAGDGGACTGATALGPNADLGGRRILPADHALNARIDALPVHAMSAAWLANCSPAAASVLRLDFSMPYTVVPDATPRVTLSMPCRYGCDPGPWPIPADVSIEGAGDPSADHHVLVLDRDTRRLYEVFSFVWDSGMRTFQGGSGVVWDTTTDPTPVPAYGGVDAAGLPILPLILRYDELVACGLIEHALRFTCATSQRGFLAPARAQAGASTDASYPPMGMRVRLRDGFDTTGFPASMQPLLTALKRYGIILADNGGAGTPLFISGAVDPRLDALLAADLYRIHDVHTTDLEVVDTGAAVQH